MYRRLDSSLFSHASFAELCAELASVPEYHVSRGDGTGTEVLAGPTATGQGTCG